MMFTRRFIATQKQSLFFYVFILLLLFAGVSTVMAQTPGGVSSGLELWHEGDAFAALGTGNHTGLRGDWADVRGTATSLFKDGGAGITYEAEININRHYTVNLNDEWFEAPINISQLAFSQMSIFTVFRAKTTGPINLWGNGLRTPAEGRQVSTSTISNGTGTLANYGGSVNNGGVYIHEVAYHDGTNTTTENSFVYVNGAMTSNSPIATNISRGNSGATVPTAINRLLIGVSKDPRDSSNTPPIFGTDDYNLAEIIVHSGTILQTDREKINTHLAIKYGMTLEHNYILSDGTVVWDRLGNSYNNNIIGMACDNGTNSGALKQVISKSEQPGDYFRIRDNSGGSAYLSGGKRALLAGHNGQAVSSAQSINFRGQYLGDGERLNRVWRLEELGNYTDYAFAFENTIRSQLPPSFNEETMVLLVASDENFTTNVRAYPFVRNGTFIEAQGIDLPGASSYVTIAQFNTALWVKADANSPNNVYIGSDVDEMNDQLLGINNLKGRAASGIRPQIANNNLLVSRVEAMNFNPYIRLNQGGNSNYLQTLDFNGFNRSTASVFMVVRRDNTNRDDETFFSYATGNINWEDNALALTDPKDVTSIVKEAISGGEISQKPIDNGQARLVSHIRGGGSNRRLGVDGAIDTRRHKNNYIIQSGGSLLFGNDQDDAIGTPSLFDPGYDFQGDIAEIIVRDDRVGGTKPDIIRSYLGVKYGITLQHNYRLSNNQITWDRVAGTGYNRRITGIGRDDVFELDQRKSRSQNNNALVTIERSNLGAFSYDLSCLIWGADNNDYNTINTNGAPNGYEISEQIWKVVNYQDKVGTVTVRIKIPPSKGPTNLSGATLLVNQNNANFSANTATIYPMASNTATEMVFENVVMPEDGYFTFGFSTDLFFVNNSNGAPSSFEACPGDNVTFYYDDLIAHPAQVQFIDAGGNPVFVSNIAFSNQQTTGTGSAARYEGEMTFNIPNNAVTGTVSFLDGSNIIIFNSSSFIIIHNPEVNFVPQTDPVCADAVVPLLGFPSGGNFSGQGVSGNNTIGYVLDAPNLNWTTNHDDSLSTNIVYTYFPQYTNGARCPSSRTVNKNITVYDNRIDTLDYVNVFKQRPTGNPNLPMGINTQTISQTTPNILPPTVFPHPFSFSGTYITPTLELLVDLALLSSPVTFRFDNNGCIGEITSHIFIYEPLGIPGLPDTLCVGAAPVNFFRDSSPIVKYALNVVSGNFFNGIRQVENEITGTRAQDSAHNHSITYTTTTGGSEVFTFDPSMLPVGTDSVVFEMEYISYTLNNSVNPSTTTQTRSIIVKKTVYIVDKPIVDISSAIDTVYCRYDEPDTLRPIPPFESASRTYFTLQGQDFFTRQYSLLDTLKEDTILVAGDIYNQLVPLANRNLPLRVIYTVDRYGCVDHDTVNTTIVAPLEPIFFSTPPYCTSDDPDLLSVSLRPGSIIGSGTGRFVLRPGVDSAGLFSPGLAGPGDHPVTYILTDLFGCKGTFTDTLLVRDPPQIDLFLDGSNTITRFCGSTTNVPLTIQLISGSIVDSVRYFGPGIIDSTLNPNSVFIDTLTGVGAGTGGTALIRAVVTDTFGCIGVDSTTITILQAPTIDLDTAFNNEPSVDVVTGIQAQHTYCRSADAFLIKARPYHVDAGNIRGTFTGEGIIVRGDSVHYDPSQVVGTIDSVIYRYEDANGCFNTELAIIKIDTIPDVALIGLQDNYCPNYDTVHLTGIPAPRSGQQGTGFSGPGLILIGLNGANSVLDPSLAGLGQKIYTYTFIDGNLCIGKASDTITVNQLPVPLFGNFQNQYCTADPGDTLTSLNDTTPPSSYFFWGNIIDSAGVLVPDTAFTGPQLIYYSYTDVNACSNVDSAVIFIQPTPDLFVSGLDSSYCYNAPDARIAVSLSARLESGSADNFGMSATTLTFDPDENNDGLKNFTLIYADPVTTCADTLVSRTYVHNPPSPVDSNLLDFYCETRDTFILSGTPSWGVFVSASNGIVDVDTNGTQGFSPARAGTGFHTVIFQASDTFYYNIGATPVDTLVCLADTQRVVEVRPLPDPKILQPTNNQSFCSNDTLQELVPAVTVDTARQVFTGFGNAVTFIVRVVSDTIAVVGGIQIRQSLDTTYYFNPSGAGDGTHVVTYTATNIFGCTDSVSHTFIVDLYQPRSFQLDTAYCESADSVLLLGGPPGGVFTRNGDTLVGPNGTPPYFVPNPGYAFGNFLTSPQIDTVTYSAVNGACEGDTTVIVVVSPVPQVSYTTPFPHNTYCLGMDAVPLVPDSLGGFFVGNGVLLDSMNFRPTLAGAGIHPIQYNFTDAMTGCSNTYVDTLYVYGMPQVSYQVVGGCQSDSSLFVPTISGLGNIYQNRMIDSITNVQWVLEPSVVLSGTFDTIRVDSIRYLYTAPGVYHTQLIVANQVHCVDTHNVRLVISPTINSYPYDQTFENGDGSWFAESRDASHSLLWEWGVDNNPSGIPADATNHIWATGLDSMYQTSEDAWVYSPCFDMDSLTRPMISLDYWSDTRSRVDGTLLEYQKDDGSWAPLGELNRGINWFNEDFIAGQPGDLHLPPIGWAGQNAGWVNGRYKLDGYAGTDNILRLRMAFGSSQIPTTNFYDGFAFDNVWIGDRTRNVLLETTSNIGQPAMTNINAHVYNLIFHTALNKDVTMVQYHTESPNATDQFYLNMENITDLRTFDYGSDEAGRAYIDGSFINFASALTDADFEVDMLQDPKFDIQINGGLQYLVAQRTFVLNATVKALEDMPELNYRIYTTITEDSLTYQDNISYPDEIHAVVRKDDDNANLMRRSWTAGDTMNVTLVWDHTNDSYINYRRGRFQGLVFIQAKESTNKEVFQVATTRDVTGYRLPGLGPRLPQVQTQFKELQKMVLFPNPANDYFTVQFEAPLSTDYNWKLLDIRGVTIQTGRVRAGTEKFQVDELNYPTGTYVLVLYNGNVFGERKVVIQRP